MRNVRVITLLGVLLLLALSACDAATLAEIQNGSLDDSSEPNHVEFTGTLETLDETSLTVEGQLLSIVPESEIAPDLSLGDIVKVEASLLDDGTLVALEVKPLEDPQDESSDDDGQEDEIEFTGEVSAIGPDMWTIADQPVAILDSTEIHGEFVVGDIVKVHAFLAEDGTLTAREIEAGDSSDMEDSHSDGESSSDGFELTGPVEAISDTEWTIAGVTVTVDPATRIDAAIVVGDWVKAEGLVLEDGSFLAVEISLEESSDGSTSKLEFVGLVEAIGPDSWTVSGREVPITSDTRIQDGIQVGDMVKVELLLNADGTLTTLEIGLSDMNDMDMDDDDEFDDDDEDSDDDSDDDEHDDSDDDGHDDSSDHEEDDHEDDD